MKILPAQNGQAPPKNENKIAPNENTIENFTQKKHLIMVSASVCASRGRQLNAWWGVLGSSNGAKKKLIEFIK